MDSQSGALANIIELARLSRLTLLYHGAAATAGDAGRDQAAVLAGAAAAVAGNDVVVLFDAGSEFRVPDLLAVIETAVLEAAPQAPLAPPMAGPVEALAFWQQALGVRFLLIMQRFDLALLPPDPEFDEVLLKLAHDPLDISILLLMDETAAPLLQGLKDALPELGETFLRLPEPAEAASRPLPQPDEPAPAAASIPAPAPATIAAAPRFGPAPFLFDDPADEATVPAMPTREELTGVPPLVPARPEVRQPEPRQEERQQERSRSRRFSTLLEKAGIAPDAFNPVADSVPGPSMPELPVMAESASFVPPATSPAPAPAAIFPTAAPAETAPAATSVEIYPTAAPPAFATPPATATTSQPLPDRRAEPSFQAAPTATAVASTTSVPPAASPRVYRERRPMQVPAWMQKRRSRRRRGTVDIASRVASSSTVLFVLMTMLVMVGWQMSQLGPGVRASPRGAAVGPASAQPPQALALRGNRYRRSVNAAASSAGTGRDTR